MPSEPLHHIDILQAALAARGYKSGIVSAFRSVQLPAGSALAIQFGDEISVPSKGLPKIILNGTCQINADDAPSAGVICLGVEKAYQVRDGRPFDLVLKLKILVGIGADLQVAHELEFGKSAIHRRESHVYLQSLVADALQTVGSLRIDPRETTSCGRAMRIEARLFGDIALGRTGVIRSCNAGVSSDYVRYVSAACEWLQQQVLPDLRSILDELAGKARSIMTYRPALLDNQKPSSLPFLESNGAHHECKTVR